MRPLVLLLLVSLLVPHQRDQAADSPRPVRKRIDVLAFPVDGSGKPGPLIPKDFHGGGACAPSSMGRVRAFESRAFTGNVLVTCVGTGT
jgi:hypothetical protein